MMHIRRLSRLALAAIAALHALVGQARAQDRAALEDRLRLTPLSGDLGEGGAYEYEKGVLRVPQNRLNPDGPVFELVFHRFPALPQADRDTPPIFLLNGGPGWPGFGPELEKPPLMERVVLPRVRLADLIVVGQRGIGTSAPDTRCDGATLSTPGEPYDRDTTLGTMFKTARACREKWEGKGVNLKGITVIEAANDVRDVAIALGYEQVQIHGGSFGSHWGMAVMRYHPDLVARAVLTGMEGPDHTYDMPGGILAALERVAHDAERSGVYGTRVPPGGFIAGGFIAGLRDVIQRADASPIRYEIPRRNPITVRAVSTSLRQLGSAFTVATPRHRRVASTTDRAVVAAGQRPQAASRPGCRSSVLGHPGGSFSTAD